MPGQGRQPLVVPGVAGPGQHHPVRVGQAAVHLQQPPPGVGLDASPGRTDSPSGSDSRPGVLEQPVVVGGDRLADRQGGEQGVGQGVVPARAEQRRRPPGRAVPRVRQPPLDDRRLVQGAAQLLQRRPARRPTSPPARPARRAARPSSGGRRPCSRRPRGTGPARPAGRDRPAVRPRPCRPSVRSVGQSARRTRSAWAAAWVAASRQTSATSNSPPARTTGRRTLRSRGRSSWTTSPAIVGGPAAAGADDRQGEERPGPAEQRRLAGRGDRGGRGVEELGRPVGVPGHRPAAAADPPEPRPRPVRGGVEAAAGPAARRRRTASPWRGPSYPGRNHSSAGPGPAAARDQPGVAGELPQVAADDEHVTRHDSLLRGLRRTSRVVAEEVAL